MPIPYWYPAEIAQQSSHMIQCGKKKSSYESGGWECALRCQKTNLQKNPQSSKDFISSSFEDHDHNSTHEDLENSHQNGYACMRNSERFSVHSTQELTISTPVNVGTNTWNNSCQSEEAFPVWTFCVWRQTGDVAICAAVSLLHSNNNN